MNQLPIDTSAYTDFDAASRAVLHFLRGRIDMDLWMMTRAEGNDWIVLQADDRGYGVQDGIVFEWGESYCYRMVRGEGPSVAPNASEVPLYVKAGINQQVEIGAYIGVPVCKSDGSLFGTLCAIDPSPQDDEIRNELPTIELLAKLLGTVLSAELEVLEAERAFERSQQEATTDDLTRLVNRRGWNAAIENEESRASRYGNPTSIVIVDLDGLKQVNDTQGHAAGDELICRAARAITSAVRSSDIVARLGGDEFGVVAVECGTTELDRLIERLHSSFATHGVSASVGKAVRNPKNGLLYAVSEADRDMYSEKIARR